jgi:hypothetical protein
MLDNIINNNENDATMGASKLVERSTLMRRAAN